MAKTNLQTNWSGVSFTPSGGSLTAILKIKNVNIDPGGSLAPNSADADKFPTTIVCLMSNPKVNIGSYDVAGLQGFSPGQVGTVGATFNDAKAATGGSIVYTVINAVVENNPGGGEHAQYGEGTLSFLAFSTDGVTSPISFSRA